MLIEGAETTASRLVICESVSLVARIASSTSRRISVSSKRLARRGQHLSGGQQAVDDVAVTGVGRHPSGRHVGMVEQPVLLEEGKLVADSRRAAVEVRIGRDDARRHRLAGVQVLLDDLAQDALLAGGEHGLIVGGALAAAPRARPPLDG